jgi:uncharacterized protein (DUF342 family)
MPPKGRPRKAETDGDPELIGKRLYQRTYQEKRTNTINRLTDEIKKCEEDLKDMKKKRKELRNMAKNKLDARMTNKEFDPDEYAKGGMSYVRKVMKK